LKSIPLKHKAAYLVFSIILFTGIAAAQAPPKVTYLYNSGWLIETTNELILIDYVPTEKLKLDSVLFKKLRQADIHNKKVYVLVTHEHDDHFYQPLLLWHYKIINLTTIVGWDYNTNDKAILKVFDRNSIKAGSIRITAHPSTDAGSGFLIKVGGLAIYHAGDHAAWSDDLINKFTDELKFIKNSSKQIDLAFLPIARGKRGACLVMESITNGNRMALEILKPKTVFPMHLQCDDFTAYHEFGKWVKEDFPYMLTKAPNSYNYEFQP